MSHISRYLAVVVLAVVVLLGVPVVVLAVAPMAYSGLIEHYVRSQFGIDMTMRDLDVTLFPLRIEMIGLVLRNPDPAFETPMLAAQRLRAEIDVGQYLQSSPTWWRGSAAAIDLHVERDAQGNSNWDVIEDDEPSGPLRENPVLRFDNVQISGLAVQVEADEERHRIEVERLDLDKDVYHQLEVDIVGRYGDEPLRASGKLALPHPERANVVAFDADVFGGELGAEGVLGQDGVTPADVRFHAAFGDLSTLGVLLGRDLSALQPIELQGEITRPEQDPWRLSTRGALAEHEVDLSGALEIDGQRYRLHQLDLSFGASELSATGQLALDERRALVRLQAPRIDLDQLPLDGLGGEPQAQQALHEIGAAVPLRAIEQWTVDVSGRIDRLDYAGTRLSGLALELAARDTALTMDLRLDALQQEADGEAAFALVEPLQLTGRLSPAEQAPDVPVVEARLATAGFDGTATAMLPVVPEHRLEFRFDGEMTGLQAVRGGGLARFEPLLPIEAHLEGTREGTLWRIDPLEASIAGEPASGRLQLDPAADPPLIGGELHARTLDLRRLWDVEEVAEDAAAETAEEAEEADARDAPLFAAEPMDWSWLDAATVDLTMRIDRLPVQPFTLRQVRAGVLLRGAQLTLDPLAAELADGRLDARLNVGRLDDGGAIAGRISARGLTPADLGIADDQVRGGRTSLLLEVETRGGSQRELAEALDGEFALEIRETLIENEIIELLGADVVAEAIRFLLPFDDGEERTDLRCAAAHVVAVDGVLFSSDRIVLETANVTVRASAVVDLHDESLEMEFEPQPREDLEIGVADIADLVQVRGSLTDPEVEADPEGVVGAVASAAAAVATAGTSLVVEALVEDDDTGTPCRAIFQSQPADHDLEAAEEQME